MRRLIVTWAQNATRAHSSFVASLRKFPGELHVVRGRYKNPTSVFLDADKEGDDWFDPLVVPYLTEERTQLCPNLCLYGDIKVQPTAVRPLTGFEVFVGHNSAIFGHPRRALEVVPSATRTPRLLVTTGACTLPNYTDSKAGKRGTAHHVLGALVIEIADDGIYHVRHVSAGPRGDFVDLDTHYTPDGIYRARRALSLTLGDLHVGREEPEVLDATRELVSLLRPRHLVLHDVLDFKSRNHHDRGMRLKWEKRRASVRDEVHAAVTELQRLAAWGDHVVNVVRSNHDEAMDRWLDSVNPHDDPENARYWVDVWARMWNHHDAHGVFPDAFALEARRLGVGSRVRFLGREDSLMLGDVEHAFHGHNGTNGSRGSSLAYSKLGCKTSTGHTHTPRIIDGNFTAGVTARLDHDYNSLPSTWLHAHIHLDSRGRRQLIVIVKGRFRA